MGVSRRCPPASSLIQAPTSPKEGERMAEEPSSVTVGGVTYHVTPHYLADAVTNTNNTSAEIEIILGQIRAYVVNLEASWQGIAQQTFQTLMSEYDIYAKMLHDSLVDISAGLNGTYVNYTQSEQTNINNLKSLDASLPAGDHTISTGANPPAANLS
jgi:WXG100 family type VII secretion target